MAKNLEDMVGEAPIYDPGMTHPTYQPSFKARAGKTLRHLGLVATLLAGYVLTACTPIVTARPTEPTPTSKPAITATYTPTTAPTYTATPEATATNTATATPRPSPTPKSELTLEDVILPIGPEVNSFVYKPCYINTETHFHAGDIIYYELGNSPTEYIVYAPIEGTVEEIIHINDTVGWEIRVQTPFVYQGEVVWYDLVHHDGPVPGIREGIYVQKGEPIAIIDTAKNNGRFEKLLDMAIRNGPRGPNPQIEPFYPESYLNVYDFVKDDLESRDVTYETCVGNPK